MIKLCRIIVIICYFVITIYLIVAYVKTRSDKEKETLQMENLKEMAYIKMEHQQEIQLICEKHERELQNIIRTDNAKSKKNILNPGI